MMGEHKLKLILGILLVFLGTNVCFAGFNSKLMG